MRLPDDFEPEGPDLTVRELAALSRVDERTIRRRLGSGLYPGAYRESTKGRIYIPRSAALVFNNSLPSIPAPSTLSPE